MLIDICDSDSSDTEIFVTKQFKPINNSSQLIQLTLQETSSSNGGVNSFNEKRRKIKKCNGRKRSGDSNQTKSKKFKSSKFSRDDTLKEKLSKPTNVLNNNACIQPTNSAKQIVSENADVKNAGKSIYSYFSNRSKESHNTLFMPENTLSISSTLNKHKSLNLLNRNLSVEKILKLNDNRKSVETEEKVKNSLIVLCGAEDNSLVKVEKSVGTSSINTLKSEKNFKKDFRISKNFNVKNNIYVKENFLLDKFQNNILSDVGTYLDDEKYNDNSKLLCFILKKIINDEMKKQMALESQSLKSGKVNEKLLLDSEFKIIEKFLNLEEKACQVFVRMLCRKKGWHRMCAINYPSISNNLSIEFGILYKEGFIDIDIEDEDLKTQLGLLNKPEVLELCKAFNIFVKSSNNSYKKETLIHNLINDNKKQKSILDMFKGKSSTTRLDLLKSKIKMYLGSCVRINTKILQVFYKILLLFSFAHYFDEEDKRLNNEVFVCLQVHKNIIKFPNYELSPTVIFETLADFEEYKNSLLLQDDFEMAVSSKNYDAFISACSKAKDQFKKLLDNNEFIKRFLNLQPFLHKFSAGTVYAKILTKYCTTFKKQTSNLEIASTAELLLDQNLFLTSKRGKWYEILSKVFENQKKSDAAADLLIKSFKDPFLNEVQILTLQLRGQSILKKKNCKISDTQLRNALDNLCRASVQEPPSVEITGKALDGNESGFKSVYVQEFEHGKVYSSVEERALSYYKSKGFTKGHHSEGFIIQSIYFLLFFDIIYGLSPEGVFQTPYQKAPLDLSSKYFFYNRKKEIELLINDMLSWDDRQIKSKLKDSYARNYRSICVITWNDEFTPDLFCEVIKCITMPLLVSIFDRLIRNFGLFRSGFPDLTLWNPDTIKCKFVEVKSPNDKLSPSQRIWLNYLRNIGLDCEVCNVKNISSKGLNE